MPALIHLSRKKAAKNPNARWEGLNEFLSFADLSSLSSAQRVAYLAYGYFSHIEMAGHHDYFSTTSQSDYPEVISALRAIGAIEQALVLTAALDAVQAASIHAPEQYSNRFAAGAEFADLTEFDERFKACTRLVPNCLMDYLEKHESEFIEWRP